MAQAIVVDSIKQKNCQASLVRTIVSLTIIFLLHTISLKNKYCALGVSLIDPPVPPSAWYLVRGLEDNIFRRRRRPPGQLVHHAMDNGRKALATLPASEGEALGSPAEPDHLGCNATRTGCLLVSTIDADHEP